MRRLALHPVSYTGHQGITHSRRINWQIIQHLRHIPPVPIFQRRQHHIGPRRHVFVKLAQAGTGVFAQGIHARIGKAVTDKGLFQTCRQTSLPILSAILSAVKSVRS